jgi:hypothetical protein
MQTSYQGTLRTTIAATSHPFGQPTSRMSAINNIACTRTAPGEAGVPRRVYKSGRGAGPDGSSAQRKNHREPPIAGAVGAISPGPLRQTAAECCPPIHALQYRTKPQSLTDEFAKTYRRRGEDGGRLMKQARIYIRLNGVTKDAPAEQSGCFRNTIGRGRQEGCTKVAAGPAPTDRVHSGRIIENVLSLGLLGESPHCGLCRSWPPHQTCNVSRTNLPKQPGGGGKAGTVF